MSRGSTAPQRDRFDDVPTDLDRVGAHRAPAPRGRGLVAFAWAALATGALVGMGVLGLQSIEQQVGSSDDTSSGSVTSAAPAATVDPDETVLVLNGTATSGLAAGASKKARSGGWKHLSVADASTHDVKLSTVYYSTASQLGAALGLAKTLGIGRTQQSSSFDVKGSQRLTVVLGADYAATA